MSLFTRCAQRSRKAHATKRGSRCEEGTKFVACCLHFRKPSSPELHLIALHLVVSILAPLHNLHSYGASSRRFPPRHSPSLFPLRSDPASPTFRAPLLVALLPIRHLSRILIILWVPLVKSYAGTCCWIKHNLETGYPWPLAADFCKS